MRLTNLRPLLRYNFGVIWGHTPWLLVIPVAAAMFVLLWNMAMASIFTPSRAAQTMEVVAPLLSAFLCAHLLGVEYRYKIGEITFSKPNAAGRILYLRLLAVYLLVGLLVAVMLTVYAKGIGKPFSVPAVVLAGIPSVFLLSMLSLMVATLFRQPAVGFLIAGLYWGLDAFGGVQVHPLLSLQGYAASLRGEELAESWRIGKVILMVAAVVLCAVNLRLVVRPEGVRSRWKTIRNTVLVVALFVIYLYTGALSKVAYGRRHEGEWPNWARSWYRQQFEIYGSLPVLRLLGRDLADYVGPLVHHASSEGGTVSGTGRTERDIALLERLVARSPRSPWADNALYELARVARSEPAGGGSARAIEYYRRLVNLYPESVFAPPSLDALADLSAAAHDGATQTWAFRKLVEDYPSSQEAIGAAYGLTQEYRTRGQQAEALKMVEALVQKARTVARPALWLLAGDLLMELHRTSDARDRYVQALKEVDQILAEMDAEIASREDTPQELSNLRRSLRLLRVQIQQALTKIPS